MIAASRRGYGHKLAQGGERKQGEQQGDAGVSGEQCQPETQRHAPPALDAQVDEVAQRMCMSVGDAHFQPDPGGSHHSQQRKAAGQQGKRWMDAVHDSWGRALRMV